jgi:hypothetical protein
MVISRGYTPVFGGIYTPSRLGREVFYDLGGLFRGQLTSPDGTLTLMSLGVRGVSSENSIQDRVRSRGDRVSRRHWVIDDGMLDRRHGDRRILGVGSSSVAFGHRCNRCLTVIFGVLPVRRHRIGARRSGITENGSDTSVTTKTDPDRGEKKNSEKKNFSKNFRKFSKKNATFRKKRES